MIQWRKASYSNTNPDNACVELADLGAGVGVRDSKQPEFGHLALTRGQLGALLGDIKAGKHTM